MGEGGTLQASAEGKAFFGKKAGGFLGMEVFNIEGKDGNPWDGGIVEADIFYL